MGGKWWVCIVVRNRNKLNAYSSLREKNTYVLKINIAILAYLEI